MRLLSALRFAVVLASAALLFSCRSNSLQPGRQTLLILPFENDSTTGDLNWTAVIAPDVLAYDLAGLKNIRAVTGESLRAVAGERAARVLQGYIAAAGGTLSLHVFIENGGGTKIAEVLTRQGPTNTGIVPLLDALAKQLNPDARPYCSRDRAALESFAGALAAPDLGSKARLLETAAGQDPRFSEAARLWTDVLLAQGDRDRAAQVALNSAAHAANPLDKARLDYLAATARGDLAGEERALDTLLQQIPDDPALLRAAARIQLLERKFAPAAATLEAAAKAAPDDPVIWNQLGYTYSYLHRIDDAKRAFAHYSEMTHGDINAIDSLGEVYFFSGDFAAAERTFLEGYAKSPVTSGRELRKAAQAHLMMGDLPGADALFKRFLDSLKSSPPPLLESERARWEWITGRHQQAESRLAALAAVQSDIGPLAASELSLWKLQSGDRAAAAQLASAAAAKAVVPAARNAAALCLYLAANPDRPSSSPLVNGIAMLLSGRFAAAIPVLERVYRDTEPGADQQIRVLLAWAYVKSGRAAEAAPLVDMYPIPLDSGEPLFSTLLFPRFLDLRAAVFTAEHKDDDARRMKQLFEKYRGTP